MNVRQLIKKLQKEDPERLVILASDAEGNSYDTLHDVYTAAWNKQDREIGLEKITAKDLENGYTEEDIVKGIPALVLTP